MGRMSGGFHWSSEGQEGQIPEVKHATLEAGHQGHPCWWNQGTVPGYRRPNGWPPLCPCALDSGLKERALLLAGESRMFPDGPEDSSPAPGVWMLNRKREDGSASLNHNCFLPREWCDPELWWEEQQPDHTGPRKTYWAVCTFSRLKWVIQWEVWSRRVTSWIPL